MFLWFVLLMLTGLTMVISWVKERRRYSSLDNLKGPKPLPILGNVLDLATSDMGKFYESMRKWAREYKDIYVLWVLNKPIINIYNPEDIEIVLSSSSLIKKSFFYYFASPWLLDGLLISSGAKWQSRRKMLTPTFHFNILKSFSETIEENSWRLVSKLQLAAKQDKVDIRNIIAQYSLNILCETAMGKKMEDDSEASVKYTNGISLITELTFMRLSKFYLHNQIVWNLCSISKAYESVKNTLHAFTLGVIRERKEKTKESASCRTDYEDSGTKKRLAMLDLLLTEEKKGNIDEQGIHEEVEVFMFAGYDTTFTGLTYLLMLLANHQIYQDKVYQELVDIFGNSSRPATSEDFNRMTYMNACIKETQRILPSVPLISREITHDVQLKSCKVPAGTVCHIHIIDLHRRADLWEDPLVYRPDRFLAGKGGDKHNPFAFIPFSAGPRNCIGQKFAYIEMKSATAAILRNFRLIAVTRPDQIAFKADGILRPHSPVYIKFESRNN